MYVYAQVCAHRWRSTLLYENCHRMPEHGGSYKPLLWPRVTIKVTIFRVIRHQLPALILYSRDYFCRRQYDTTRWPDRADETFRRFPRSPLDRST